MARSEVLLRGGSHDGRIVSVKDGNKTVEMTSIFVGSAIFKKGWAKDVPAGYDISKYASTGRFEDDREVFECLN